MMYIDITCALSREAPASSTVELVFEELSDMEDVDESVS